MVPDQQVVLEGTDLHTEVYVARGSTQRAFLLRLGVVTPALHVLQPAGTEVTTFYNLLAVSLVLNSKRIIPLPCTGRCLIYIYIYIHIYIYIWSNIYAVIHPVIL